MLDKLRKMLKSPVSQDSGAAADRGLWSGHRASFGGDSVGAVLRAARLETGLELRQVAASLRIRAVFVQAIESGRYQDLPGIPYGVGFVRTYAEFLGLDAEHLVSRFKEEVRDAAGRSELYFPSPLPEAHVPGGTMLLIALVLGGLVYGGWYVLTATDRSMVDLVPALPQRLLSLLDVMDRPTPAPASHSTTSPAAAPPTAPAAPGHVAPAPAPPPVPAPAAPAPVLPLPGSVPAIPPGEEIMVAPAGPGSPLAPESPAPAAAGTVATAPAADELEDETPLVSGPADDWENGRPTLVPMTPRGKPPPPPPPSPAPAVVAPALPPGSGVDAAPGGGDAPRVLGGAARESRLHLRARQETWLQVRDIDGEVIFAGVLKAGDVFRVPERAGLRLRTGNAGGITASLDGTDVGALGGEGQVLQDLPLEALRTTRGR